METAERKRVLAAIFSCIAIYGLTLGFIRPLLALILDSRGIEKTWIGLNATMPAFGMLIAAPLIPRLIKLMGIQRFLFSCLILDIFTLVCYPLFDHLYAWFALGLLAGAATNSLLVASETWLNEIALDATRGRLMAGYNALLIAAMSIGPLVIPFAGISGWLPFLIGTGFVMLSAVPLFWLGSSRMNLQGKSSFSIMSFVLVAPVLSFAVLLFAWKEHAGSSLLPVYGVENGLTEASAAVMLTVLGLGGLFLSFPFGWLADKMNRYFLLVLCGVGVLVGAISLPFVIQTEISLWVILFLWGGVFGGLYTVILTIVGQRFRGMELAVANIAIGVIWGIGSLTGPSVAGVAMDAWEPHGLPIVFMIASATFVTFAVVRWLISKDKSSVV